MMGLEGEEKWGGIMGNWDRKNGRGRGVKRFGVSKPGTNKVNSRKT